MHDTPIVWEVAPHAKDSTNNERNYYSSLLSVYISGECDFAILVFGFLLVFSFILYVHSPLYQLPVFLSFSSHLSVSIPLNLSLGNLLSEF